MNIIASVLQLTNLLWYYVLAFFSVYIFLHMYMFMYVLLCLMPHLPMCIQKHVCQFGYTYSIAYGGKCEIHPILLCHPHIACGHFRHFTSKGVFLIYWLYHYISPGIERVSEFNFLGLTINEFMSWNSHSKKVSNKVSRVLGIMYRLKHFLPFSALRLMYQSLVNCHLQFCILAWGYECKRVYNLQKKAIRIMTASKYNAHTEPLFKQLNIMKIEDSFEIQCLKFYYKFKTNTLPAFFDNIFYSK